MSKTLIIIIIMISSLACTNRQGIESAPSGSDQKLRTIVTSDGEVDDECSMVRFLLYSNEWDVKGIISTSSQYHWKGHRWAGDDWINPYLEAYEKVYPNLILHDKEYPSPEYLRSATFIGNVDGQGEMDSITPGSQHIVKVLLDETDNRPVWIQAWGGTGTIARALKSIEEEHPEKMDEVAAKLRFFFIWEQDSTYQSYIRPHWGKYNILTIISDQFWAIAYQWNKILPEDKQAYFRSDWMKPNILEDHGALCSLYKAHVPGSHGLSGDTAFVTGDFRSEGDSPAFLHLINTGLRNSESPAFGGWGGHYVNVRDNTWLDPVPVTDYKYPEGRWYTGTAWGRKYMREEYPENPGLMHEYFGQLTRWTDALQNDFAARADWCVESYKDANHPPVVVLQNDPDIEANVGERIKLSAKGTSDPDGDKLSYKWWQYGEADSYPGDISVDNSDDRDASFVIPADAAKGQNIHIICEVKDKGIPQLTRYERIIINVTE